MDSYNMPTKPPRNLPGYYFKLNYHNFKEDHMKNVYGAYHKLSDTEREKVAAEFQKVAFYLPLIVFFNSIRFYYKFYFNIDHRRIQNKKCRISSKNSKSSPTRRGFFE